ncbi:MAG: undecaprenyl-diphosphatase [Desulfonauticus sp.]|jgi:undecaprenyl-diphosphatase|nr:MAG: Undecaprenyl-diphosphatase [Desulfonauticus sp. 38_4375]MDK2920749.1 undecaprenyl-diphosphatase [Desulfonauticus sp.]
MNPYLQATILGIVEGLTEFLPISSTGHLILSGHLLQFTGEKANTFDIVIQLGAILAVVVLYKDFFLNLFFDFTPNKKEFKGIRGIYLLFLTTLPASILGLLTHSYIKKYLFTPFTVSLSLLVGAIFILVVENKKQNNTTYFKLDQINPKLALGIGLFQCLALWPGFSRSAATIIGGMLLGLERKLAAKYSFLAAVPIMFAATGYDLLKNFQLFNPQDLTILGLGFIISFFSALVAIKTFIYLLGKITLKPFAIYRIILALIVLFYYI